MTEQPHPIHFRPVPAFPIVVLSHRKGECRLMTPGGTFTGATLREAIEAARQPKERA